MSRVTLPGKDGRQVVTGLDHVCGYFIQVYPNREDLEKEATRRGCPIPDLEDYEWLLIDEDQSPFTHPPLTRSSLTSLLEQYCLPGKRLNYVKEQIALDLNPAL
jgi:hypothetical protein